MHFGTELLTGRDITLSFGVGKFIDPVFMDAFVKCIAEDDFNVRPECHGFRIFLQPLVLVHPLIFQTNHFKFYFLITTLITIQSYCTGYS